ncbi:hypothetical protein GYMLUDRAFT_220855 [Collybiopsis luxurians FD-317 M1]|nr:hypothetical protein GYMLUDRAFT_220855 [Collybiopsis luxurians FD-317 M1]
MDKISEKFESDEVRKKRLEAEEAERRRSELEAEKARHHHHGFMDKIGEAFEGEEAKKARLEAEEAERKRLELEAEKARHQHHGLMNKISEAFEGEEVRKKRLEAEEAQRKRLELEAEKARHHHLPLDMFSKLGLGNEPVNAAPTKANEESLLDKLGSQMHLSGDSATQALLKEETLAEKIESSLHHKRPEDKVHHGGGISDKIQSALGGGSKAEESEDDLDKAIDFVQHHILRQGTQSHETILEQMKDEQIARTIRAQYKSLTGREFPMKKGEKHWH